MFKKGKGKQTGRLLGFGTLTAMLYWLLFYHESLVLGDFIAGGMGVLGARDDRIRHFVYAWSVHRRVLGHAGREGEESLMILTKDIIAGEAQ